MVLNIIRPSANIQKYIANFFYIEITSESLVTEPIMATGKSYLNFVLEGELCLVYKNEERIRTKSVVVAGNSTDLFAIQHQKAREFWAFHSNLQFCINCSA